MICYQHQSISKLMFYLLKTEKPPSDMRVLKRKRIQRPNYQVDLRIIGTSHALSIATPHSTLTEVVACSAIDQTRAPILSAKPLCESDGHTICLSDLRHSVDWKIQRFTPDTFWRRVDSLYQEKENALIYQFPARRVESNSAPLTLIRYTCHPKRIQIQTYHTYPNELGLVATRTEIELR